MNEKLRDENLDTLFEAFMKLKNRDEFYCLFEDLFTISATISRVNKCLNYGANGYRTAIERLEK